jgi:hypothetical protein
MPLKNKHIIQDRNQINRANISYLGVLYLLLLLGSVNLFAQPLPKTNQQVLQEIIIPSLFATLKQAVPIGSSIIIHSTPSDKCGQWLAKILTDSCVQANYLVYSSADSMVFPVYRVTLTNTECQIIYHTKRKKWFVGKSTYLREIKVSTHLQIANPASRILFSRQLSGNFVDKIASEAIAVIENPDFSITKGTKTSEDGFKRWVEPLILSAATVAVILSFYSLRSNN